MKKEFCFGDSPLNTFNSFFRRDVMFNNVGRKLKDIASVITYIGIALSVILGILMIKSIGFLLALLIIAVGSFISWISSIGIYAFGELVDNSTIIASHYKNADDSRVYSTATSAPTADTSNTAASKTAASKVGIPLSSNPQQTTVKTCPHCGEVVRSEVCGMCGNKNNLFGK